VGGVNKDFIAHKKFLIKLVSCFRLIPISCAQRACGPDTRGKCEETLPKHNTIFRESEYHTLFGLRNEQIFPAKRTKEPLKKKKGKKHITSCRAEPYPI